MIDHPRALSIILDNPTDWGTESVPLRRATGRILRQTIHADRDQPPFDRVSMDGIAFDYASYVRGRRTFPVSHLAPAGAPPEPLTDPTHCVEIMTGAPLPPGCTTVVRYEDLQRNGGAFTVPEGIADGRSIHRRGSDGRAGDLLLEAGIRIGAGEIAALATCGYATVTVARLPRVAIASTGDEVVAVGETPLPHQIRSSNVHQLASLFRAVGIDPTLGHLPDAEGEGRRQLAELIDGHDLILLSGGVSKGKLDHVPKWLAAAGVEQLFHRVAQRPGKPLWVGRREDRMVFALPGNPVSSLVCTLAYVGPFLRDGLGYARKLSAAELARNVSFRPDLTLFGAVRTTEDAGRRLATPVAHAGSGDLLSLLRTDGFLVFPRGRTDFLSGEAFPYLPLSLY